MFSRRRRWGDGVATSGPHSVGAERTGRIGGSTSCRPSVHPERIVKVRESAPSKIGLLCIALFTVPRADDDVVVDDRLMMACNIYIFQLFSKKLS